MLGMGRALGKGAHGHPMMLYEAHMCSAGLGVSEYFNDTGFFVSFRLPYSLAVFFLLEESL